jgi:hypothetical protein
MILRVPGETRAAAGLADFALTTRLAGFAALLLALPTRRDAFTIRFRAASLAFVFDDFFDFAFLAMMMLPMFTRRVAQSD